MNKLSFYQKLGVMIWIIAFLSSIATSAFISGNWNTRDFLSGFIASSIFSFLVLIVDPLDLKKVGK